MIFKLRLITIILIAYLPFSASTNTRNKNTTRSTNNTSVTTSNQTRTGTKTNTSSSSETNSSSNNSKANNDANSDANILNAKNFGKYEAQLEWNGRGFDCNINIQSFHEIVKRSVFAKCKESYNSSYMIQTNIRTRAHTRTNRRRLGEALTLINACKVGAMEVVSEKRQSCHQNQCIASGSAISNIVTGIICHCIVHEDTSMSNHPASASSTSVLVPHSCVDIAISSCIAGVVPKIEERIIHDECRSNGNNAGVDYDEVRRLCDSFVQAFTYA
jgi:hypothetical protein